MFAVYRTLLPLAGLACCLAPSAGRSTGCVHDIVVPIQFRQGAVCWRHVGVGTTFNGRFGVHQHVTATAIGQTYNSDGKRSWGHHWAVAALRHRAERIFCGGQ